MREITAVHIVVSGRVQGVGYRYFVRHIALEQQINGWVKNLPNGKVEIEAYAEKYQLKTFIDWLKTGPQRAIIRNVEISYFKPTTFYNTFLIK